MWKVFFTKNHLEVYFRIYTGEMPYLCNHCDRPSCRRRTTILSFNWGNTQRDHANVAIVKKLTHKNITWDTLDNTHWGEGIYIQPLWPGFLQNSIFKLHSRKHIGENSHRCSYCEKGFVTKIYSRIHLKIHTGENPYLCSICDNFFMQNINFKHYLRKHKRVGIQM